jgi:hypothetical protein
MGMVPNMWHLIAIIWTWLSTHEWLAIWLEGVALVAIFIWDRIDSSISHKQTLEQLEITRQQAEAARNMAQSVLNSERAWLTADLEWHSHNKNGRMVFTDSSIPPDQVSSATTGAFALRLTNDGRTPAWVGQVAAAMEISGKPKLMEEPVPEYIEPLGAGQQRIVQLTLTCPGKLDMTGKEQLSVHITVHYRDIFETKRMELEFSVDPTTDKIRRFGNVCLDFIPRITS